MGSLTEDGQVDLRKELKQRDQDFEKIWEKKRELRKAEGVHKEGSDIPETADSWWQQGRSKSQA